MNAVMMLLPFMTNVMIMPMIMMMMLLPFMTNIMTMPVIMVMMLLSFMTNVMAIPMIMVMILLSFMTNVMTMPVIMMMMLLSFTTNVMTMPMIMVMMLLPFMTNAMAMPMIMVMMLLSFMTNVMAMPMIMVMMHMRRHPIRFLGAVDQDANACSVNPCFFGRLHREFHAVDSKRIQRGNRLNALAVREQVDQRARQHIPRRTHTAFKIKRFHVSSSPSGRSASSASRASAASFSARFRRIPLKLNFITRSFPSRSRLKFGFSAV